MKKIFGAAALLALTGLTHAAGYGVVDLEKVVEQSTYLKQQNSALKQQFRPQAAKIEQLTKDLEGIQQRAQQGQKLNDAEKQKMSQQYQAKLKELNDLQQQVQAAVESNIQALNRTMDTRIKTVAEQLRKDNSLDVVLNKNSALAYDARYDLTDKMIQKVNAIK